MQLPLLRQLMLGLMTSLASSASLDLDQCKNGESFWCQSLAAAEACGAVQHCLENVWKDQALAADDDAFKDADDKEDGINEVCPYCSTAVLEARLLRANGKSEREVIDFLNSACDRIPNEKLISQCRYLVARKAFRDVLFESSVQPSTVCSLLGRDPEVLHLSTSLDNDGKNPEISDLEDDFSSPVCSDCTKFFGGLKNFLSKDTLPFLQDVILDKLCPLIGSFKVQCEENVKIFFPLAVRFLLDSFEPSRPCRLMKLCSKLGSESEEDLFNFDLSSFDWEQELNIKQASTCTDCVGFFEGLKRFLKNDTMPFIQDILLDRVCPLLGPSRKQQCENAVKRFIPMTVGILLNFLESKTVCKAMKICPKLSLEESELELDFSLFQMEESSTPCDTCRTTIKMVEDFLRNPATAAMLPDMICPLLGPFAVPCKFMAKVILPKMIAVLVRILNPNTVCRWIRICPKLDSLPEDSVEDAFLQILAEEKELNCTLCKLAVQVISEAVDLDETEVQALDLMQSICQYLPQQSTASCLKLVNTQGREMIQFFQKNRHPEQLCALLTHCKALDNGDPMYLSVQDVGERCVLCQTFVQYGESYLNDPNTLLQIENQANLWCANTPTVENLCKLGVKKFIPLFVHKLAVYLTQKSMCTKFGMCPNDMSPEVVFFVRFGLWKLKPARPLNGGEIL